MGSRGGAAKSNAEENIVRCAIRLASGFTPPVVLDELELGGEVDRGVVHLSFFA